MLHSFLVSFVALFSTLPFTGNKEPATAAPEIISISVAASGSIKIDNSSTSFDKLHTAIEKKLWNKYLTTGKMQDRLQLRFIGEVLMGTRGAAMDELLDAQQNTLKKLCIKKYAKVFDGLTAVQQVYVKRKFPVLFQTDFK